MTLSLASVLREGARRTPDAVALVQGDRRVTYAQAWDLAMRVAGALRERGEGPGSRVALLAPNTVEFVAGYYGVLALGATVVPVPTLLRGPEAAYLLGASHATTLLYHPAMAELATAAAELVEGDVAALDLGQLAAQGPALERMAPREADDVAVLFFTSGTTGRPKAAMLTHLNLVMSTMLAAFDGGDANADDVAMACLPLFHVYGQLTLLNATLRLGGRLVLQPRFDPMECIALMVREGVTVFAGVPTMYVGLLAAADGAPALPTTLRLAVSGGAPAPVAVLERFEARFGVPIHEGYGLSETASGATANQSWFGRKPGTVGHPMWGVEAEIADPAVLDRIETLPVGQVGEVVIRGHQVFAGYLDDPEATAAALVDGWFRTGDLGRLDDEGFLTITDRTKDLIIRSGFNVYPREVEEVLMGYPGVEQVAVVGIPDEVRGEEVYAVVTVRAGAQVSAEELRAFGKEHLADHKYPRVVKVVETLPLGPSHKVLKRELRATISKEVAGS